MRYGKFLVPVWVLLFGLGCGKTSGTSPGNGADTVVTDSTGDAVEDLANQGQDITYEVTDPRSCSHDIACGEGKPDCPEGFICGDDNICQSTHCHCNGCANGYACDESTGDCHKDKNACNSDAYCEAIIGEDYKCVKHRCVLQANCKSDADCADKDDRPICDTTSGRCVQCKLDKDCEYWFQVCQNGTCVQRPANCNTVDYDHLGQPGDINKTTFFFRMLDPNAEFFTEAFPDCKDNPNGMKTRFRHLNSSAFISGGAGYFGARFTNVHSGPKYLYLGMKGMLGFWRLPLSGTSYQSNIVLVLKQNLKKSPFTFYVIGREKDGTWGALAPVTVKIMEAGGGPLQVSVVWQTQTDVDLHLEEPGGFDIYYGCNGLNFNPNQHDQCKSPNGGILDIDSNAACDPLDGIRNENIYYGGTPPNGQYTIRVAYWSNCDESGNTDFLVTLWKNGKLSVWTDTFTASDAHGGGKLSGRIIHQFTWP